MLVEEKKTRQGITCLLYSCWVRQLSLYYPLLDGCHSSAAANLDRELSAGVVSVNPTFLNFSVSSDGPMFSRGRRTA